MEPAPPHHRPWLSIIIPVLHATESLGRTLASLRTENLSGMELIVVDGGQEPEVKVLLDALPWLHSAAVTYIGEPDGGIYDAMNKALGVAGGRYCYFLGAGDTVIPGALAGMRPHLEEPQRAMIYGNVLRSGVVYDGHFTRRRLCHRNICHQAAFYSLDLFALLGAYSLRYPACADWEFNMRCFADPRVTVRHVNLLVATFEPGGRSSQGDTAFKNAHGRLIRHHFGWWHWAHWVGVRVKSALRKPS